MNWLKRLVVDYDNQRGIAYMYRARRAHLLRKLVLAIDKKPLKLIDIGGTEEFWKAVGIEFLLQNKVEITLVNLPGVVNPVRDHRIFTAVEGDGCALEFSDMSFDMAFSNSVIEHVGGMRRMRLFAAETQRMAPVYYCQTPSFWFPLEPHFLFPFYHWLPEPLRVSLIRIATLGNMQKCPNVIDAYESVQSAQLLTAPAMKALFPEAKLHRERTLALTKSYVVIRESQK